MSDQGQAPAPAFSIAGAATAALEADLRAQLATLPADKTRVRLEYTTVGTEALRGSVARRAADGDTWILGVALGTALARGKVTGVSVFTEWQF